jgi:hypothetical protein
MEAIKSSQHRYQQQEAQSEFLVSFSQASQVKGSTVFTFLLLLEPLLLLCLLFLLLRLEQAISHFSLAYLPVIPIQTHTPSATHSALVLMGT